MKRLLGALAALLALTATVDAAPGGADLGAALVRCADVTYPAPLTGCGDDPLATGRLAVGRNGDVAATLTGAAPGVTYDLVLQAANVSQSLPIAVLATDGAGNAAVHWASVFDTGQAGIVAFTLGRNGSVEFVAGFSGRRELEAGLMPCAAINTPSALAGCGADTLRSGKAEIDEGDLKVELSADPNLTYAVVFRGPGGGADVPLATLTTDRRGKGSLRIRGIVSETVTGSGNVVLQRDGLDQFLTGFQSTRHRPIIVARFDAGLLRCADVDTLAPLAGCGFDQLNRGQVVIDDKGDVNVHVMGAVALSTYEVFFVSADATTEVSLGTFTTNPAGNGNVILRDAFPVGTRGVGHVILKRNAVDQFVTGFAVSR